jgi:hypothetical protein
MDNRRRRFRLLCGSKRQPLEQEHVLLVLQERAVQRRDQLARIALPEHFRGDVLVEQQFQPVQELRSPALLFKSDTSSKIADAKTGVRCRKFLLGIETIK